MNYSDSARIQAVLKNCGWTPVKTIAEADIVIFDTCSVRQKSEDKVTGKLKEIPRDKKIWITWCMIQHGMRNQKLNPQSQLPDRLKVGNFGGNIKALDPLILWLTSEEINQEVQHTESEIIGINHAFNPLYYNLIQKWPNIELFFRIDDTGFLPLILQKIGYQNIQYDQEIINEYNSIIPEGVNSSMNAHEKTAYIPIATGCNQFCAYCIVPYARGLEKRRDLEEIVAEAKKHLANGVKEIVLLGQIVNKHPKFIDILEAVLDLEGLEWLRYTSPFPSFYSEKLLQLHEKHPKLCPHIHIPLQSGSAAILKKMFRGYDAAACYQFIDNIRALQRPISITTDIILGFPGETEADFEETLKLAEYGAFDMIYMGIYSNRPGTYADKNYPDDIPYQTKHQRWSKLNKLLHRISTANNLKEVWNHKTVLINEISTEGELFGYSEDMKQVIIATGNANPKYQVWDFVPVKIIEGKVFKLYGEILEQ